MQRWNSIHNQILFFILLFLIIPLFISTFWIDKPLERVIENKIGNATSEALYQIDFNLELLLQDMLKSAVDISTNPNITSLLKHPDSVTYYEKLRITDNAMNKLYTSYFSESYVTLLDMHGNWVSNKIVQQDLYNEYIQSAWYKEMLKEPFGISWMVNDSRNYIYYDKSQIVTLIKTITDVQTNQNIGIELFSVNESDLRKYISKLDGNVMIMDHQGKIISSSVKEGMDKIEVLPGDISGVWNSSKGQLIVDKDHKKWIASFDTIGLTGWKLIQFIPYDTVFKEIFVLRRTNMFTVGVIVAVFMLLAFSISNRVSKPIKLLNKRMKEIEKNDFNSSLALSGPNEIATLIDTYNHMARQIRDLLQRLKDEYVQKEEMRFRALQAQINPHFILNTLNNIKWMAYIRNDREVGEMLSSLGSIMEASIGRGETLISLKEEMDYVQHYITLMKLRYNDKLTVEFHIPEPLMKQEAIKFMLQPIIENSILHGIEQMEGRGVIAIKAVAEQDQMILTVTDNGSGIRPDKIDEINHCLLQGQGQAPSRSIGIMNVHERIRLQYGEGYGLHIQSKANETTVEFKLPLKTIEEGNAYASESTSGR
ncbi:sensor histidine kinase [Paenibacillus planticolens]|uniref:HAMP domain-containing protein n=1 Tax=Paenibacillus planticolens TaxID=2654976 RepID=A0ABX1ZPM8_9BACL|nr:sensor histidine kinase [Paenibacillus planticolens]NOV00724.1 HAMP domain-containing protein [Paenibacillus planticolens]